MQTTALFLLVVLAAGVLAVPTPQDVHDNEVLHEDERRLKEEDPAWSTAGRIVEACGDKDLASCLGAKAVAAMGRAVAMPRVSILPGVTLVKVQDDDSREGKALVSEDDVHNSLEQEEDKVGRLAGMLLEAAARFLRSHVLQFRMPEAASQPLQRALQEGRGKKKILRTLMPLLMGLGLKLMALVPLGLGVIGLLAAKALLVSKVALILAGVLAAQKLLGSGAGSGLSSLVSGNSGGAWSSSPPAAAGWAASGPGASSYYRSLGDDVSSAHEIAYKAQAPQH